MKNTFQSIHSLYSVLPGEFRKKLILIGANTFLMILLDVVGIGLLLPLLVLVLSENSITANPYLNYVYTLGGFNSPHTFIMVILGIVLAIALIRLLLASLIHYKQSRALFAISQHLSMRLYRLYYSNGFLFVKMHSSHKLINKIEGASSYLIQGYFIPFVTLLCEGVVTVMVLVALMIYNIEVFGLVVLTFAPISFLYYKLTQKRIRKYGERLYTLYPQKAQLLQQTFVGYGDMTLSGMFDHSAEQYKKLLIEQGRLASRRSTLQASLQRVLEFTVICSVVLLVATSQLLSLPSLGLVVGLFAIAIYRVMPGVVKSSNAIFTMKGNSFALSLLDELKAEKAQQTNKMEEKPVTFEKKIDIENITFGYEEDKPVLSNLSLQIERGSFLGIKGESGTGKSTLFYLLLGFVKPWSGRIMIDNTPLSDENKASWCSRIGYVSQQLFMVSGSMVDNIVMGAEVDLERVEKVLALSSLTHFVESLPEGAATEVGEGGSRLSGGQRQRLGIARALYRNVEVLLLDEATSSLDIETQESINEALLHLKQQCPTLTIIVISHRSEALAVCSRIVDIATLQ